MKWRGRLGERFSDVWTLLSDTDRFLSRARLAPRYERRLREWRHRLNENRGNEEITREIRNEIVAVRKALREEGWELRLGSVDVEVKGFRSDDATLSGFRRMVILLSQDGSIHYNTGSENHLALEEGLRHALTTRRVPRVGMAVHYLWYRVSHGLIELAGADSEPRDHFDAFRELVETRKSDLVRAFKGLS